MTPFNARVVAEAVAVFAKTGVRNVMSHGPNEYRLFADGVEVAPNAAPAGDMTAKHLALVEAARNRYRTAMIRNFRGIW